LIAPHVTKFASLIGTPNQPIETKIFSIFIES
jgi:hypothetical protein